MLSGWPGSGALSLTLGFSGWCVLIFSKIAYIKTNPTLHGGNAGYFEGLALLLLCKSVDESHVLISSPGRKSFRAVFV